MSQLLVEDKQSSKREEEEKSLVELRQEVK